MLFINYQIFCTRKQPHEKNSEFGRTVDPDSHGSSRDVGGSELFAVAMALFGLAPLCDGTLRDGQLALWGQRKEP